MGESYSMKSKKRNEDARHRKDYLDGLKRFKKRGIPIIIDGKECSDSTIKAGTSGRLSLKVKTDNRIIEINDDSAAANRIEWNVSAIEGAANVDENGYITTDKKINGVVSATVDNQNVYTVLGGKDSTCLLYTSDAADE